MMGKGVDISAKSWVLCKAPVNLDCLSPKQPAESRESLLE